MTRFILLYLLASVAAAITSFTAQAQNIEPAIPAEEQVPIALLVDIGSGQVIYERSADRRFVPASITKVMTAYTAFELIKAGELRQDAVLSVRPDTFRRWRRRGSTMFLGMDHRPTVNQLLHGITTVSANDGSVVLAEGAAGSVEGWTALMNKYARAIGMSDSHFANPNGWMDDGKTYVTARDLGRLAEAMVERHPDLFRRYVGRSQYTYNGITQDNHDPLIGSVRGADGIKTGFTYEAGFGFLGTAKRQARRLVMVVGGTDSPRIRRNAARSLMEWGFDAFETRYLFDNDQVIAEARVQNGDMFRVPLIADGNVHVSVPRGNVAKLNIRVEYNGPLRAPIAAEEVVAELVVTGKGVPEARIPLHAQQAVGVAGPLDRMMNAVMSWFV